MSGQGSPGVSQSLPSSGLTGPTTIRPLRWADERLAAHVLAGAFVNDPLVMAICQGGAADRVRRMWWNFRIAVRSHCQTGQPAWGVIDASGQLRAVVLVILPGARVVLGTDLLFALRGLIGVGFSAARRGVLAANTIAAHEPAEPFTYLRTIGVDPQWQRRGVGSALVGQVVQSAALRLPIYLETSKAVNLPFYTRHGFTCCGEFRCLGVPVWRMMRRPAAESAL